jgi:TATA-binding protein-associated factor Taf7
MDFLEILLEAEKPKAPKTKLKVEDDSSNTDYTADADEAPDDDDAGEDTSSTEDDDTSADDSGDEGVDDDDTTDYTQDEDMSDPSTDGDDADDTDTSGGDDGSTDDTGSDDTASDDETSDEEAPEDEQENENQRILIEDFSNLYYSVKNTITKLNSIDKSNIIINKIVTQITTNLNLLKKQLFDFITFNFLKGKYVTNLYKYNYFLEAFRINTEMLKKIRIFIPNSQNN